MNRIADALPYQNKSIIIKEALANGRVFRNANFKQYAQLNDALELLANKYNVGVDIIALKFAKTTIPKAMVLSGASNRHIQKIAS